MTQTKNVSFSRNLRGFLGITKLGRSLAASRIGSVSKSLSSEEIEPIDATFAMVSDGYESPDHLDGFQSVTRQLLASDVLDSLIQMQSEMLTFDDTLPAEQDSPNARAALAYQQAQQGFPSGTMPTTLLGS